MSIGEYRQKFDYQNIALSKFEEIMKVQRTALGTHRTSLMNEDSLMNSKIMATDETIMND